MAWQDTKLAVGLLAAVVLIAGCANDAKPSSGHAGYTCAQLATDFGTPGDAPSDRGQAVVDSIVSRVKVSGHASDNVRDEVVYALATACAHRPPTWQPVATALNAVQRVYRQQ